MWKDGQVTFILEERDKKSCEYSDDRHWLFVDPGQSRFGKLIMQFWNGGMD